MEPRGSAEELTPQRLLEHLPLIARTLRCYPDYDEAFLEWAFAEMENLTPRGLLVRSLIRDDAGRFAGWYIYFLKPGGECWVIQLASRPSHVDLVVDHLVHHAYVNGGAAVRGRAEPQLLEAVAKRGSLLRYAGESMVFTRDTVLLGALLSRACLLTHLEGEWWRGDYLDFPSSSSSYS